jgi:hypothetical protein
MDLGINRRNIIYTNISYWRTSMGAPGWGIENDLWIAAWGASSPVTPSPWQTWHFHQYTNSGVGADYGVQSSRIDLNRWNGTAAQLAAYRIPRKPTVPQIDMGQYFLPANGNYGDILILRNNWGGGDERQQLQRDGQLSYVTKNSQWERRFIGENGIFLQMDSSPGDGEYYKVEGQWLPRQWRPGETFTRTERVTFFRKSDCQPVPSKPAYTSTSAIRFEKVHANFTTLGGVTLANVIELAWIVNGAIDERYFYAPHLGLCQWEKHDGRRSWAVQRIPLGQQGNNVREVLPCAG